nr:hypothetical protein [uncultured Bacteroides sp.]
MEHTYIKRAEENDLNAILALQKESFTTVAKQMNKFDIPANQTGI